MASLCLHFGLFAQAPDTSTYQGKMDYLLQPLNPSRVISGILYDRVEPVADIRNFGHRPHSIIIFAIVVSFDHQPEVAINSVGSKISFDKNYCW